MLKDRLIEQMPLLTEVAAISCGLYQGAAVLDLDYAEDSAAGTDANFVITGKGELCEIQATAEDKPFNEEQFLRLLRLARLGVDELVRLQRQAVAT
jgi:ribonuclease PH